MCNYQQINIGINFNTPYLNEVVSYFIGGIIAADEFVYYKGNLYWIAPVRHNPSYILTTELNQHFTEVDYLGQILSAPTFTKNSMKAQGIPLGKFNRLTGFGTFFESTNMDSNIINILPQLSIALNASSTSVKRSFLAGVFDGRGAIDHDTRTNNIRFISLDATNDSVRIFLNRFAISMGYLTNSNFSRDRLEGGNPRENQFRIIDVEHFASDIGFISTKKMNMISNSTLGYGKSIHQSTYLPGLKQLY